LRTLAIVASSLLGLGLAAGCGEDPPAIPAECNPLGGLSCLAPWPSSVYLEADSTTVTGHRVRIPVAAMPTNTSGVPVDPTFYERWDGFSPSGPIVAAFPGGVSAAGLPPHTDIARSLAASSPIVLVDMDRGERAEHFAEVDMNVRDPAQRALIIRPTRRLRPATRYAVGITRAVRAADGGDLPVSDAFAALRDGASYRHPRFAGLAERADAVFAALAAEGVARADLVLAWDFVTASDEMLTADLLAMRADGMAAMGEAGANLSYTLREYAADPALVYKLFSGTLTSPDFLTDGERDESVLRRDAAGRPQHSGMRDAQISVIIPRCVEEATLPIPVMIFGHGLFGSGAGYLDDRFFQQVSDDYCFVVLAGDWIGLTERQIGIAALAVNDLNLAGGITEKLAQSVIDFIAIQHAIRGPLRDAPELTYQDNPVIDPTKIYYFGASLGGIMGTVFLAYDPVVERGALAVPGGPWSMMFERSFAWNALQGPARASYPDPANFQVLISLMAMRFEPYDPITAAPHLLADPLPGTPIKQVLMYEAIGDSLVANVASETLARTIGLPVVMPSLLTPFGMEPAGEASPNGFAIYDEQRAPLPSEHNTPPEDDNGTHAGVHKRAAVLRQIETFLYDGVVVNQCSSGASVAPCDCAAGACQ
jgi:hypothetical protein